MNETLPEEKRELFTGIDHVVVPDYVLKQYQTSFGEFIGNTRLPELTSTKPEGETTWSDQVTSKAWDLSFRLASQHEMSTSEYSGRPYSHENIVLLDEAIQYHGFNAAMATGISAVIGNRAMKGHRLTKHEKDTLRSLPINNMSALTDIIGYTLAAYKEGFRELRQGKLAGVVTETYLATLADAYTVIGNNYVRPKSSVLPASIDSMQKLKLRVLIEGHAQFAAEKIKAEDDPYLELGKAFLVKDPHIDPTTQKAKLVPLDISALVDMRGTDFRETLAGAQDIYKDLLDEVKEKQRDIQRAGGLRKGGVVTAVAASTSIFLGQQAAAAVPNQQPTALPHLNDTTISVTTVEAPSYKIGITPTDIGEYAMAVPISVQTAETNPAAQAQVEKANLVTSQEVKIRPVNVEDPIEVATLAAKEGMSEQGISAIIQSSLPEAVQDNPTQTPSTQEAPAEKPTGVGNQNLRSAMQVNAENLSKWLQSSRSDGLSDDIKNQIDVYTQYIKAASDNPDVLNALLIHKSDFVEGKVFAGQADTVKALMPKGIAFFNNKRYEGNTLTNDQVEILAGLWANAQANLLTDSEREALKPKPVENYDERPNDVGFGENAPSDKSEKPLNNREIQLKALDVMMKSDNIYIARGAHVAKELLTLPENLDGKITLEIAFGAVANVRDETGTKDLDFSTKQKGGPARGGFQWEGGREDELLEFADRLGKSWRLQTVQLMHFINELEGPESAAWNKIKNANSSEEAATLILEYFERAADSKPGGENDDDRRKYAGLLDDAYEKAVAHIKAGEKAKEEEKRPAETSGETKGARVTNPVALEQLNAFMSKYKNKDSQMLESYKSPMIEMMKDKGYKNGRIPASHLVKLTKEGHSLHKYAAYSLIMMQIDFEKETGKKLTLGSDRTGYRDLADQIELKAKKGKFAAKPGTSGHGWAASIDVNKAFTWDTLRAKWLMKNAWKYGWVKPVHLSKNSDTPEAHHYNFILTHFIVEDPIKGLSNGAYKFS